MIQKRILMLVAIPVAAAVARFASGKLRASGKTGIANAIDQVTDFVSPQKQAQQKKGFLRR